MTHHTLRFNPGGQVSGFYTEAIDLHALGRLSVVRATEITFDSGTQRWEVRRAGSDAVLFSHPSRQMCLRWELENLEPGDVAVS